MNAWQFMLDLNQVCHFMSRERTGKASNSEIKRWLQNQAIRFNGEPVKWDEPIDFPVHSVVMFPKNPVTLF
jgi:23S rRNA-/tRNA-specific pseudouridylate synthase